MIDTRPTLIVTRDGELLHVLVTATKSAPIEIRFDAHTAAQLLRSASVSLVVLDDEVLTESERGWLIDECHRWQPNAPIVYVASPAPAATETMARSHGISHYAARPVDAASLRSKIRRLRRKSRGRRPAAPPLPVNHENERHGDPTNPGTN